MRIHTRNQRMILALSLAVALFAATASTASTTATPPLTLSVEKGAVVPKSGKLLRFGVRVSNDSTLVATGSKIEKTRKQVAAAIKQCPEGTDDSPPAGPGECCTEPPQSMCISSTRQIEAKLKHRKRLFGEPKFKAKIKVAATDEFGQTTSDKIRFVLRRCPSVLPDGTEREALYSTGTCNIR